jgi:hypothetical protein
MRRLKSILFPSLVGFIAFTGCKRSPELPPELREPPEPAVDVVHVATLSGSERITVTNLILEVDEVADTVTLRSSGTGGDSALYLTGALRTTGADVARPDQSHVGRVYEVIGPGDKWTEGSPGLRTPLGRYQPGEVVIRLGGDVGGDARGKIEGTFFRFSRSDPLGSPPTEETIKGSFVARVVR